VAATAAADGTWRFVDRHGRVLFTATKLISGVPTVDGPVNPGAPGSSLPPASQLAYEAIARVPPALAGKVAGAAWNGDGSTSLTLSSGREVLLPPADRLGDAFVALATVLASPKTGTGIIDLRAPNAPAIQPAAPATTLAVPSLTQVTL
jgi:cell division septal protein FtsQ